jgi:hypothetical protein
MCAIKIWRAIRKLRSDQSVRCRSTLFGGTLGPPSPGPKVADISRSTATITTHVMRQLVITRVTANKVILRQVKSSSMAEPHQKIWADNRDLAGSFLAADRRIRRRRRRWTSHRRRTHAATARPARSRVRVLHAILRARRGARKVALMSSM